VIVSRGPGSYTGLRVGIMSAKTLAYAAGCALIAVDTFAVLAGQAPAEAEKLDVLADAQQDKLYVQSFARESAERWRAVSELSIMPAPDWLARRDVEAWVSGPGVALVAQRLPEETRVVEPPQRDPGLASLLRLGLERYQSGRRDDLWTLEPLYARLSSAEEKLRTDR
jgi:tRNA threonylcarbamoyladenosine biosynthesis protein TsaB